jgi:transcriptional regulator with XRE-family HTH domain
MIDLKAWRKARALTQEQAADMLGITPRQVQRLEAGHNKLTPSLARLLELIG